ncbi:MAG: hypothetical protein LM573_02460 [Thermofilum sp.]|nr:hypothetical protein [Thermofilum sp.]
MKIYEIRDNALYSVRLVYKTRQLAKLVGVPDSHAKVYAYRLVQKGMAWRLSRGSISFTHDTCARAKTHFYRCRANKNPRKNSITSPNI